MREDRLMENLTMLAQSSLWRLYQATMREHTARRSFLAVSLQQQTFGKGKGKPKGRGKLGTPPKLETSSSKRPFKLASFSGPF